MLLQVRGLQNLVLQVSYGTNGFFLKFASGAFGTDSSGEGNDFTVVGTMTTTKDTPDDNYCTINELSNYWCNSAFSNGNNTIVTVSGNTAYNLGSMSVTKGKWYWETLVQAGGSQATIGTTMAEPTSATNHANTTAWSIVIMVLMDKFIEVDQEQLMVILIQQEIILVRI